MTTASQTREFRIPPGRSINLRMGGLELKRGPCVVSSDEVPAEMIPGYLEEGFLIPLRGAKPDLKGIEASIVTHDSVRTPEDRAEVARTPLTPFGDVGGSRIEPLKRIRARSCWEHDPDTIRGRSLEEMNLMIVDLDPRIRPFETVEEAVAQLSADFQGKKGV